MPKDMKVVLSIRDMPQVLEGLRREMGKLLREHARRKTTPAAARPELLKVAKAFEEAG